MKKIQLLTLLWVVLPVYVCGQSVENINASFGDVIVDCEEYTNNLHKIWNIDIGSNERVKINYDTDIEDYYDYIKIYSIDASGSAHEIHHITGWDGGTVYSTHATGKIKVEFITDYSVHCYIDDYYEAISVMSNLGFTISFSADDRMMINNPVRGNSTGGALRVQTNYGYLDLGPQDANNAHIFTDRNQFLFNKPIHLQNGMINSAGSNNLYFQTNNSYRMTVLNSNGNVGIGTTYPYQKLQVNGNVYLPSGNSYWIGSYSDSGNRLRMHHSGSDAFIDYAPNLYFRAGTTNTVTFQNNGNVGILNSGKLGIGGHQPQYGLDMLDKTPNQTKSVLARLAEGGESYIGIKAYDTQPANCTMFSIEHLFYNRKNNAINFHRGGDTYGGFITFDVCDGNNMAKLSLRGLDVYGIIQAKEVIVSNENWPDYVFSKDYQLPTLQEISRHIDEKQHLPGIPSSEEVAKDGINLSEMNAKLLQKIEEMTLYMIQQQQLIEKLEQRMNELENKR
jgi:hypothetical protein